VLASGSKANATFVEVDGVGLLLDCGLGIKALQSRLATINRTTQDIDHVLITHQHGDHIYGLPGLLKRHPDVQVWKIDGAALGTEIFVSMNDRPEFSFIPFRLSHDEVCTGYAILDAQQNKLGYVTDTGCVPEGALKHLFDCNALIWEFNHDIKMLTESVYPSELQERICSETGHMENDESRDIIKMIASERLRFLIPFHLSGKANNEEIVQYEAGVAVFNKNCKIICAKQTEPTDFFTLM